MILYVIKDWNKLYENNRTRELKKLDWLPLPNKQDGDGYTELVSSRDGASIFGCWIAMLQIASKCTPRGSLIRATGEPHTSQSLERMSRLPARLFSMSFPILVAIKWVDSVPYENPAPSCDIPAPPCPEEKGTEGKEENNKGAPDGAVFVREFPEKLKTGRIMAKWAIWQTARRAFKKPKSWAVLFDEQVEWLSQFEEQKVFDILSASIRNGWQGLFEPKGPSGQTSAPIGDNYWKNTKQLEQIEDEIKCIVARATLSADGPIIRDVDKEIHSKLKARRKELKAALGLTQ